jgi:hypothetical protein
MDLLGPSLEDLKNFCSKKFTCSKEELARFSLKTVLMLADQLVSDQLVIFHVISTTLEFLCSLTLHGLFGMRIIDKILNLSY